MLWREWSSCSRKAYEHERPDEGNGNIHHHVPMEEKRQPRCYQVALSQVHRENMSVFRYFAFLLFAENESEETEVKLRELISMLARLNKEQLDVLTDFLKAFTEK